MKKLFVSKNFMSKIALILVCLILFQVVAPKPVRAEGEGGTLLRPIVTLMLFLSDGVISILQESLFQVTEDTNGDGTINEKDGSVEAFEYIDLTGTKKVNWLTAILISVGAALAIGFTIAAFVVTGGTAGAIIAVVAPSLISTGVGIGGAGVALALFPRLRSILSEVVFGDSFTYANILITPEALLKNQIALFDANFFRTTSTGATDMTSKLATTLRNLVSNTYSVIRNISIMAMLIVIVYIAIRMLLALSPREKSRYKEGFVNCIVGLIIILGMHYMMSIANTVIDNVTNSIIIGDLVYEGLPADASQEDIQAAINANPSLIDKYTVGQSIPIEGEDIYNAFVESSDGKEATGTGSDVVKEAYKNKVQIDTEKSNTVLIAASNFQENARYKAQQLYQTDESGDNKVSNWEHIGWAFVYVMLTILTVAFVWMYGKRLLYLAGLTMFAPIVGVMYPINRVDGSRAHTLNLWFKEYFGNLIIQPFHMLLYSILIGSAMAMAISSPLYVIIALMGLVFIERLMKDLLGIQDTRIGGLGKSLQETNRAIKTATRETANAAKAAKRGVDNAVRKGVGFAQDTGRRLKEAGENEEANATPRLENNAANTTQPETKPDGTGALEAPVEEKTPQQKMLDVYDEGFGTGEWDAQDRDVLARDAYAKENAKRTQNEYQSLSDEELAQKLRDDGFTEEEIPEVIADMKKIWNAEEEQKEMLDSKNSGFEADGRTPQLINEEDMLDDVDGEIPQTMQPGTTGDADEFLEESEINTSEIIPIGANVNAGENLQNDSVGDIPDQGVYLNTGNNVLGEKPDFLNDENWSVFQEQGGAQFRETKSGTPIITTPDEKLVTADFARASGTPKPAGTMAMKEAANSGISMDVGENPSVRTMGGRSIQGGSASLNTSSVATVSETGTGGASAHDIPAGNVTGTEYSVSAGGKGEVIQIGDYMQKNDQKSSGREAEVDIQPSRETRQDVQLGGNNTSGTSTKPPAQPSVPNDIDADVMRQVQQEQVASQRATQKPIQETKREVAKQIGKEVLTDMAINAATTVAKAPSKAAEIGGRILEGTILGAADAMAGNPAGVVQDVVGTVKGGAAAVAADRGSSATRQGMAQISNDAQYLVKEGHSQARAQYVEALCAKLKEKGIVIDDRRDMAAMAEVFKDIGDKKDKTINSLIREAKRYRINGDSKKDYEKLIDSKKVSSSAKDALLKLFDSLKG